MGEGEQRPFFRRVRTAKRRRVIVFRTKGGDEGAVFLGEGVMFLLKRRLGGWRRWRIRFFELEMAQELLKRGWYLGFDGPITYKNARKALEVLEICPLDRILIETDSPYLSPVPVRGKRNDSRNLVYVTEKIAEIKGITPEEAAAITMENGKKLFNI